MEKEKVSFFVDDQNLYYPFDKLKRKLNYRKLIEHLRGRWRDVISVDAFIVQNSVDDTQLADSLRAVGIRVHSRLPKVFPDGKRKADWDMGIAIAAIMVADTGRTDIIVLVTGDGDFVPLVRYLKMRGIRVEVASCGKHAATSLKMTADEFHDLDHVAYSVTDPYKKSGAAP